MILHRRDLAQCRPQQASVGFGVSLALLKRLTPMQDDLAGSDGVAVGMVQVAIGKPHDVARQRKGNHLPAPVFKDARQAQDTALHLVYVGRRVTLAKDMGTRGEVATGSWRWRCRLENDGSRRLMSICRNVRQCNIHGASPKASFAATVFRAGRTTTVRHVSNRIKLYRAIIPHVLAGSAKCSPLRSGLILSDMPMSEKRILVVDDDPKIRALLRRCLEEAAFHVDEAESGTGVREAFGRSMPDLVTLDLNLGSQDGLDIARDIRRTSDVPIIMITGKDDVIDRVVGLELGADDYITKPFHVREMLARVRTVLRRAESRDSGVTPPQDEPVVRRQLLGLDGLTVDRDGMVLTDRDGAICDLTTADFKLLCAFIDNPKRLLSRDRLMDLINGPAWTPLDRAIDNQVARLRKKIERDPAHPLLIKTVRGIGYTLTDVAVPLG
jgi:DNA-binding response OmpR family regulator